MARMRPPRSVRNGWEPAFPTGKETRVGLLQTKSFTGGLTKREMIAALALQGVLAYRGPVLGPGARLGMCELAKEQATSAVLYADLLLEELARAPEPDREGA